MQESGGRTWSELEGKASPCKRIRTTGEATLANSGLNTALLGMQIEGIGSAWVDPPTEVGRAGGPTSLRGIRRAATCRASELSVTRALSFGIS